LIASPQESCVLCLWLSPVVTSSDILVIGCILVVQVYKGENHSFSEVGIIAFIYAYNYHKVRAVLETTLNLEIGSEIA